MPSPYRLPQPGEPFVPLVEHTQWVIEARIHAEKAREARQRVAEVDFGVVFVRNDTGGDLTDDRPIVRLASPLYVPANRSDVVWERPIFSGDVPTDWGQFAVCHQPVAAGELVLAVTCGVVWAKVQIENAGHLFCRSLADENGKLVTDTGGQGEILWLGGESGTQWAIVRLGNTVKPTTILGKTDAAIAKGAQGNVSVYNGVPGAEIDTTKNVFATNKFADVDGGTWVVCDEINGHWYLTSGEC